MTVVVAELVMTLVNTGMLYLDAHIMQKSIDAIGAVLPIRLCKRRRPDGLHRHSDAGHSRRPCA